MTPLAFLFDRTDAPVLLTGEWWRLAVDCNSIVLVQLNQWWGTVAYLRGGPRCDAPTPFGPIMKNFYRRLYMRRWVFCRFPARITKFNNVWWFFSFRYNMRLKSPCEIASDMTLWFSAIPNFRKNGRICDFYWTFKSKKCSASGGLRPPDPPTRGSAHGPRWGLRPLAPVIASRSTRSPCPPLCQILNMPLMTYDNESFYYCLRRIKDGYKTW